MKEIHLQSPRGWINDPNGFLYYKGKYHLFYQHFPYAPRWGRMHWGHAVSEELTDWEHLDIALFPTKTGDCDGCFSGSAVEKDGKLCIFYTGVRYETPDPENTNCCLNGEFVSSQLAICSEDGEVFDNFGGKLTVIPPIEDAEIGDRRNTRDPKVWKERDGLFYMVLGSTAGGKGRLLFYRSADLKRWEYVNHASAENYGWMWECPDYFKVGDAGVLIFSPMGTEYGNQAVCTFAEFSVPDGTMRIDERFQLFDYGMDLYAPQSTEDAEGRRTVIAWLRMPEAVDGKRIGMFCIPRVCEVENGHIYFRPHPNIRRKLSEEAASPPRISEGVFRFQTSLAENEEICVGGYVIGRRDGKVFADRSAVINGHTEVPGYCETPPLQDGFSVEVYVDRNMVEVFVNDGEYVITHAVYGLTDGIRAEVRAEVRYFV